MTLRELIEHCSREGYIDKIGEHIQPLRDEWSETEVTAITSQYKRVAEELVDLHGENSLDGHSLCIENDENCSVLLMQGDEVWSLDFIDWNCLIDLPIKDKICKTLSERLARILYEITFWGMTRESVLQQAEETKQASQGKLIEITMEEFLSGIDGLK